MPNSPTPRLLSGSPTKYFRVRYAGAEVVRGFLDLLSTECERYCILAGYGALPTCVSSDIDFMVSKLDFERLPCLLKSFAGRYGLQLVQAFDHEISARYYILVKLEDKTCLYLHPDSAFDYRRDGRKWLDAESVLDHRRPHPHGFWIPAPADEFDYYLVKKMGKGELNASHGTHLSELYAEDPEGCREALRKRWSPASITQICDAAASNDWLSVSTSVPVLGKELLQSLSEEGADVRFMEFARKCRRLLAPTGCWITLLGPDGSGKSSLIEALTDVTQLAFRNVHSYHLRPGLLLTGRSGASGDVTDPHGLPTRSFCASLAKLAVFWCDYVGGYWLRVRPKLVRSTLVIFDRYFHDLLVDPKRYRYQAPRWLTRLAGRFLPLPDLVFILDAPAEILQARKREVSLAECTRQREAYKRLAEDLQTRTRTVVIDTSRPFDESMSEAAGEIFGFLEARMARRYRIGPSCGVS